MSETIKLAEGDVVIGTKQERYWLNLKERIERDLEEAKNMIKLDKEIIKVCNRKIKLEAKKLKR